MGADMSDNERNDENKKDEGSWDFRELSDVEEQKKELLDQKKESGSSEDEQKDDYEEVCFICRRPESKAGKMFKLPNHICVCNDCMHKTMDTVSQFDYQGMLNYPGNPNGNMNDFNNGKGFPNISFVNLADLQGDGGIPNKQKIKKKKKAQENVPVIDIKNIMPPHQIKAKLDDYVVGQEHAKKVMSVAVYNHYKRVATGTMDEIEIEKSNMLMIGPTGCGKTYLVKTLARLLDVPLAITDATSLTEAGYIGDDIESVVSKLLAAALTQPCLRLFGRQFMQIKNTRNILFICGGAFPDLDDIIKQRLNKKTSIGYNAELRDKYDKEKNILSRVTVEDIKKFGMIPEFIGRLPIIFTLEGLSKEMMVKILSEPRNAILKQYQKLLALDEVKLEFDTGALEAIAEKAIEKDTGARALRAIIEEFMLDIMYEIPKDDNIGRITITREYVEGTGGPIIDIRSGSLENPDGLRVVSAEAE